MPHKPRSTESPDFIGFRLRGQEIMWLESFSDAVFDLIVTMRGFPAFALYFSFG